MLHPRAVRRGVVRWTPGVQCRLLHGRTAHAVVQGRIRHDRRRDVGRHLHLRARICGRRRVLLHADGGGVHRRPADRRLRARSDLLSPAGGLPLPVSRRSLRRLGPPHRRLVLLPFEDGGGGPAPLCRLHGVAAARVRCLRRAVLGQCVPYDGPCLALHPAGRRQIAHTDRYAADGLPRRKPAAHGVFHHAGAGLVGGRYVPRGRGIAPVAHLFSSTTPHPTATSGRCSSPGSCCWSP